MSERGFDLREISVERGGVALLSELTLRLAAETSVALVGRSGAGKSTLLAILAGLEAPSRGELRRDGELLSAPGRILVPPQRRGIAMVFQDLALWPNLTLIENVRLGLSGAGLSRRTAKARASEALARCGIAALARRRPGQVSGGEAQRAALARAIAARPRFLFLDEPFGGLDLETKDSVLGVLRDLSRADGIAVLLVTHDPFDAAALCGAAVVMEAGRVLADGSLAEILREPSLPLLRSWKERLERGAEGAR